MRTARSAAVMSGVVASGSVDELRSSGAERVRIVLDGADAAWLRDVGGITVLDVDGQSALVELDDLAPSVLLEQVVAKTPVAEFSIVRQPLSDIFREVIK